MLEEQEARRRVLDQIDTGPVAWLPVPLTRGLFSAKDVVGIADFPEFDNSSMDGYAVRAAEAQLGAKLAVLDETQPAGLNRGLELPPRSAIRIFTGAPIPDGADAVIMQEDVTRTGDLIEVNDPVVPGENIRRRGGDICAGQKIVEKGDELTPPRLAVLASQGFEEVAVHMQPMVHVVTTGDELIQPGGYRLPGQIFDSNGILLKSVVEENGGVAEHIHIIDDPEMMARIFEVLLEISDFLVIAGGVSVGERDFVKDVLKDLGVETNFWRVRIKPGKPFLYGKHPSGCQVFGLPGNPVSAYVTFQLFVAPALKKQLGRVSEAGEFTSILGEAGEEMENRGDRPHYLRGTRSDGKIYLSGTQQSHAVFGLSRADCLIRLDPEEVVKTGEKVSGIVI